MAWMIFLYAVNTHQLIVTPSHRYATEEECKMDAEAVAKNGASYAICRKVS